MNYKLCFFRSSSVWSIFKKIDQKLRALNHQRIQLFRILRRELFKLFFNQNARCKQHLLKQTLLNPEPVIQIIVLRLDGKLGDTITFSGFLKVLQTELGQVLNCNVVVTILAQKQQSFIYDYLPTPFKLTLIKKGFLAALKQVFKLRHKKYDFLICTSHILDPATLCLSRFLKAKQKIVFKNEDLVFFNQHVVQQFETAHVTQRYQQVLSFILNFYQKPATQFNLMYSLQLSEPALCKVRNLLTKLKQLNKKIIVLNSFAGASLRNLNQVNTYNLIRKLVEKPEVHVISIANQGDLKILQSWKLQWQANIKKESQNLSLMTEPFINQWHFFEEGDFAFNLALIHEADLVITPDTSLVHAASALNKPLLAIYREDVSSSENEEINSVIWAPFSQKKGATIFWAPYPDLNQLNITNCAEVALNLLAQQNAINKTKQ